MLHYTHLYNIALEAPKYNIEVDEYIERYPDFEEPALYLKDLISSYSTQQCMDDLMKNSVKTLYQRILQDNEHIYIDIIKGGKSYSFFGYLI